MAAAKGTSVDATMAAVLQYVSTSLPTNFGKSYVKHHGL